MNFIIKNLGPIINADINLKPLTVFVGENNTGKTYAAYSIFDFFNRNTLHNFDIKKYEKLIDSKEVLSNVDIINLIKGNISYFEDLLNNKEYHKKIQEKINENIKNFENFFGAEPFINGHQMSFKFNEKIIIDNKLLEKIEQSDFNYQMHIKLSNYTGNIFFRKEKKKRTIYFLIRVFPDLEMEKILQSVEFKEFINKTLTEVILYMIIDSNSPSKTEIFPVHRNTLSIDVIEDAINSYARKLIHPKDAIKGHRPFLGYRGDTSVFPTPVIEFIDLLDMLMQISRQKEKDNKELFDKVTNFETEVLGGKIVIRQSKDLDKRMIKFEMTKHKKDIDIVSSSSMIQQISSFILFLKYYPYSNCLIIIDEPESNLHPKAQLKFIELISYLVNNGYWIIITTHTPYIVDHINNLIYGYEIYNKLNDDLKKEFKFDPNILINPNIVSAYLFQTDGNTKQIMEKNRINWDTFGSVTDILGDIKEEIKKFEDKSGEKKE